MKQRSFVRKVFVGLAALTGAMASADAYAQGRGGAGGQDPAATPAAPMIRTASIAGQVVDADTGAPIGGAVVRLQSRLLPAAVAPAGGRGAGPANPLPPAVPPGTDAVITDGDGRFVFHDLPKGATQLTATASGFLDRPAAGVPQRPVQLEDGQHFAGVRLRLLKVASVSGVVLDEAGEPVVGLPMRVLRREVPQGIPRLTLSGFARTDDRGQYRLDNLAPGHLYVLAPQTQTTVPVADAERSAIPMSINLNPLIEAMTGGTQTSLGSPGVRVGDQMLRTGGDLSGSGNAPPPPVNGRIAAYQTTFYPGVTQLAQAMVITLRSGEDRAGADFQIRPTASARVSGVLTGATGPAPATNIRLIPAPGRADDDALVVATATTAADGAFTFLGVPSGQYVMKAQATPRGGLPAGMPAEMLANIPPAVLAQMQSRSSTGESSFLQTPIAVGDRDVAGLSVSLRVGAKVSGKVVFDGVAAKPATLTNVQVSLAQQGGGPGAGNVQTRLNADATFKSTNYAPGVYAVNVSGVPAPWLLRSVTVGGRDVIASGLEIGENDLTEVELTFTDRPSAVTGFVRQDSGGPLPNATVLLIAADFRAAISAGANPRQQMAAVQPTGAFTFGRMLPGDYVLVAVPDEAVPIDRDVAFFEAVARSGTRVTLSEGETKSQDLKFVRSIR